MGFNAKAQCTITPSCSPDPNAGYCTMPAVGAYLPDAEEGVLYTESIQMSLGTTAAGGAITIYSAQIMAVSLPQGLTSSLNPSNGIPGGSNGCIEITGTPANEETSAQIDIEALIETNGGTVTQNFTYYLNINASSVGLNALNDPFILYPNPAENSVTVSVTEPRNINVVSVFGALVLSKEIVGTETIDVRFLSPGVYFVVDTKSGVTMKLIKQ